MLTKINYFYIELKKIKSYLLKSIMKIIENHKTEEFTLKDSFQRKHNYLRISLTDKCNLRCQYCMPEEKMNFLSQKNLMTAEEIFNIASTFVMLGVNKIRLTGGEPLLRKDADIIMKQLSQLPAELCITTNGILVNEFIDVFKRSGIKSVNISLDTLHSGKFKEITQRNKFDKVIENIHILIKEGFHVKINLVVIKKMNDDELPEFIKFTKFNPVHVRFIEFMPFAGNGWNLEKLVTYHEMLERINSEFITEKLEDKIHSTSKKFRVPGNKGTFAFITTMSEPFCGDCNRLRITADGKIKNCLFSRGEADILTPFRNGEDIIPVIRKCLGMKAASMGGQTDPANMENRSMIQIGG